MTTNFKYELQGAKAASINGMSNVIKEVQFAIVASDGLNETSSFFPVELDDPIPHEFIGYQELTKENIVSWIVQKLGDDRINSLKNGLQARLAQMSEQPSPVVLQEIQLPSN
jgi:hypothetical protein